MSNISQDQDNIFMSVFKYYKSNKPLPSLEHVIKSDCDTSLVAMRHVNEDAVGVDTKVNSLGLKNCKDWKMFKFKKHPGLILIRNPFTSFGQQFWIRKCLEEYPRKPNRTNIDIERHIEDWWQECFLKNDCNKKLQKKLRWTTLGYHHNWDTKVYNEEHKNLFPVELSELCDVLAQYLGYKDFRAEAAIVNYYHMASTLSAHTDHSELNLEAPLFSFSFGQSAIFLIGGLDKSIEPSAVLLDSGDIVVMSKEARLCYHAVPKIISASTQPWNKQESCAEMTKKKEATFYFIDEAQILEFEKNNDHKEWSKFNSYVEESRININVRQVLRQNQTSLIDCNCNYT